MSDKKPIAIEAFVAESERAAVQSAAAAIRRALSQAGGDAIECDCAFHPATDAPRPQPGAAAVIVSLLPELKNNDPWPDAEQRLRARFVEWCGHDVPVFVCTILRHVRDDESAEAAGALIVRIRRLNLLAAEISRESGAFVVDIDRALADIGARRLQTDYRLEGDAAVAIAGHLIAATVLNNALDDFIPYEALEAARAGLAANQPRLADGDPGARDFALRREVRSVGKGRRRQTVLPVIYTEREVYADWFVRQLLRGKIGPREFFDRVGQTVRQHGIGGSIALAGSLLTKQLQRKRG